MSSSYQGRLNVQHAMLIIDSLLIFQHFSIQYSEAKTFLVRNCSTVRAKCTASGMTHKVGNRLSNM